MGRQNIGASSHRVCGACCLLFAIAVPGLGTAATIVVPIDQPTIQAAVTAAAAGDHVLVEPGTYHERVRVGDGRHRLVIVATNKADPPILVGGDGTGDGGIHIDRVDDVTLENLVVRGATEGVFVDGGYGARLAGLRIEGAGRAIHLRQGGRHRVVESEIVGTHTAEGILVDGSPEVLIREVAIDGTQQDGILVKRSRGVRIAETTVSNVRARHGILVARSPETSVEHCTSRRNVRDGIRVRRSPLLELRLNDADDNGGVGLRIDRCAPFASIRDVFDEGNRASANAQRDVIVTRPACRRSRCGFTSRPRPGSTSSTTVTTTTTTFPPTVPTTPIVTSTTQPIPFQMQWRLYVRIAQTEHAPRDVNVPYRSTDAPLVLNVPPSQRPAFRAGDQVTAAEVAALGGDTLQRFEDAAAAYIAAHAADYPEFDGLEAVHWVMPVETP